MIEQNEHAMSFKFGHGLLFSPNGTKTNNLLVIFFAPIHFHIHTCTPMFILAFSRSLFVPDINENEHTIGHVLLFSSSSGTKAYRWRLW